MLTGRTRGVGSLLSLPVPVLVAASALPRAVSGPFAVLLVAGRAVALPTSIAVILWSLLSSPITLLALVPVPRLPVELPSSLASTLLSPFVSASLILVPSTSLFPAASAALRPTSLARLPLVSTEPESALLAHLLAPRTLGGSLVPGLSPIRARPVVLAPLGAAEGLVALAALWTTLLSLLLSGPPFVLLPGASLVSLVAAPITPVSALITLVSALFGPPPLPEVVALAAPTLALLYLVLALPPLLLVAPLDPLLVLLDPLLGLASAILPALAPFCTPFTALLAALFPVPTPLSAASLVLVLVSVTHRRPSRGSLAPRDFRRES